MREDESVKRFVLIVEVGPSRKENDCELLDSGFALRQRTSERQRECE